MKNKIDSREVDSSSEFCKSMLELTGNDMRDTGEVFSLFNSKFDEDEAQRVWDQMLSKAHEIIIDATEAVDNKSEMVILLCAMCIHIMLSVGANAQELAFKLELGGISIEPLDRIYGHQAPPPAR